MISFIDGTIEHLAEKHVIVSANGVGYRVTILPKMKAILAKNRAKVNESLASKERLKLFIHSQLNMREGTFDLYGFDKKDDLDLFGMLISVSGIGPKNAMNILSTIEPKHLKAAVMGDDTDFLKKISGLGPKTAQRLILELKNKIEGLDVGDLADMDLTREGDALDALTGLGYNLSQAKEALKNSKGENLQQRVKEALKVLGKK